MALTKRSRTSNWQVCKNQRHQERCKTTIRCNSMVQEKKLILSRANVETKKVLTGNISFALNHDITEHIFWKKKGRLKTCNPKNFSASTWTKSIVSFSASTWTNKIKMPTCWGFLHLHEQKSSLHREVSVQLRERQIKHAYTSLWFPGSTWTKTALHPEKISASTWANGETCLHSQVFCIYMNRKCLTSWKNLCAYMHEQIKHMLMFSAYAWTTKLPYILKKKNLHLCETNCLHPRKK